MRPGRLATIVSASCWGAAVLASPAPALAGTPRSEIVVEHAPATTPADRADVRRDAGVHLVELVGRRRVELVSVPPSASREALAKLEDDPRVAAADPNAVLVLEAERYAEHLWGIRNRGQVIEGVRGISGVDAHVERAWRIGDAGGETVAVIDGGADLGHEDLRSVTFRNRGELGRGREANRRDDDGNGYVDDWRGWDVSHDTSAGDNHPAEVGSTHGSHVAGTVAAARNGRGVVGVAADARVLAIRAFDRTGRATTADVLQGLDYSAAMGARIVNLSFGGPHRSEVLERALRAQPHTLFVAAAGNRGRNVDPGRDETYPCSYALPNVLCVGAHDNRDARAAFPRGAATNYGRIAVDLFAPGKSVLSVRTGGGYAFLSGTSMAAPHVSATLALMRAASADDRAPTLRSLLLGAVEARPGYRAASATGGRLDAFRAVLRASRAPSAPSNP